MRLLLAVRSIGAPTSSQGRAQTREEFMSVYRVTEIIGTSPTSWEEAAKDAVTVAAKSLRDLRVAEVIELDMTLGENGQVEAYRSKLRVSFKYEH
jgi:flavin-binding protein dodecin